MNLEATVSNWILVYTAELLSFSIVLSLLAKSDLWRPILFWILSNIFAAFAMLTPSTFLETDNSVSPSVLSFMLSAASNWIVYLSVNFKQKTSWRRQVLIVAVLSSWAAAGLLPFGWVSLIIAYVGGTAIVFLSAWAAYKNPEWRGLLGRSVLVLGFIVCAALILWRGLVVVAHRVGDGFAVDPDDTALGMRFLVATSFLLQIGFASVIIGWQLRQRRERDRELSRDAATGRRLFEEQKELEKLADERLDMLSLLTHEVRQPIANAQAALEALEISIEPTTQSGEQLSSAVKRAQSVLDGITLSISNAILGVSLVDNHHATVTKPVDAREIFELATSDCSVEHRSRISFERASHPVFADLDPTLIRLALRNLLDNAIKYSVPGTAIRAAIRPDDQRCGVSFVVTNTTLPGTRLTDEIFGRRVRRAGRGIEGSGHGLYLVKKVADAHHGSVTFDLTDDGLVTFDLFVPC